MSLCGTWLDGGHPGTGKRYGLCSKVKTDTHCPHPWGDDDEWCCICVQPITHERSLEAYEHAYGPFEEDKLPNVLDDDADGLFIGPIGDPQNTRAKGRVVFLAGSEELLTAWLGEISARQCGLVVR